jgi:hypothetical protein
MLRPAPANLYLDPNPRSTPGPPHLSPAQFPMSSPQASAPNPRSQSPRHHTRPTRRVSHLGPAGGVCGGGGRLGLLMLKGANCHRESGRPGQLQTLPLTLTFTAKLADLHVSIHTPQPSKSTSNQYRHTQHGPYIHSSPFFPNLSPRTIHRNQTQRHAQITTK